MGIPLLALSVEHEPKEVRKQSESTPENVEAGKFKGSLDTAMKRENVEKPAQKGRNGPEGEQAVEAEAVGAFIPPPEHRASEKRIKNSQVFFSVLSHQKGSRSDTSKLPDTGVTAPEKSRKPTTEMRKIAGFNKGVRAGTETEEKVLHTGAVNLSPGRGSEQLESTVSPEASGKVDTTAFANTVSFQDIETPTENSPGRSAIVSQQRENRFQSLELLKTAYHATANGKSGAAKSRMTLRTKKGVSAGRGVSHGSSQKSRKGESLVSPRILQVVDIPSNMEMKGVETSERPTTEIDVDLDLSDKALPELLTRQEQNVPLAGRAETLARLSSRMQNDLPGNIVRQARILLHNADSAEIKLVIRPPELGRVRIQLNLDNGHIAGRILVDNGSVREVVEQNLSSLQRAFEEQGLQVGNFDVESRDDQRRSTEERSGKSESRSITAGDAAERFNDGSVWIIDHQFEHQRVNIVA